MLLLLLFLMGPIRSTAAAAAGVVYATQIVAAQQQVRFGVVLNPIPYALSGIGVCTEPYTLRPITQKHPYHVMFYHAGIQTAIAPPALYPYRQMRSRNI
jgi:hypothetical protein